jgi:hypothetical protein
LQIQEGLQHNVASCLTRIFPALSTLVPEFCSFFYSRRREICSATAPFAFPWNKQAPANVIWRKLTLDVRYFRAAAETAGRE